MTDMSHGDWTATVDVTDLKAAVRLATGKSSLSRQSKCLTIEASEDGLKIGHSGLTSVISMNGVWPGPVYVDGPLLRRLAPKLAGPAVRLLFTGDALVLNTTRVPASSNPAWDRLF